jgi:hypothetical protein
MSYLYERAGKFYGIKIVSVIVLFIKTLIHIQVHKFTPCK